MTAVLAVGGAVAAHATPTPDSGPEAGGTTVTVVEPAGVTFTSISAGGYHSIAIGSDGNTYAWGHNYSGQLGDGTDITRSIPVISGEIVAEEEEGSEEAEAPAQ